jgi:hypothetical protein
MEHPIPLDALIKDEALKSAKDFPENLRSEYASKHFVLVDGFFNEGARLACLYFKDNINQLKELGFTCSQLRYRSTRSIFRNAETLHRDILAVFSKYKKPIVLIGHSMGGGEALCLILQHPELMIDNIIDKVGRHSFEFVSEGWRPPETRAGSRAPPHPTRAACAAPAPCATPPRHARNQTDTPLAQDTTVGRMKGGVGARRGEVSRVECSAARGNPPM